MSNKKILEGLLKNSKDIKLNDIDANIDNPIPGVKWKIEVEGEFKDMSNKMSISYLSKRVDDLYNMFDGLSNAVNELSNTVNGLSNIVINLSKTVENLAISVEKGFKNVNSRLDKIENRLDILESFHEEDFKKLKLQQK